MESSWLQEGIDPRFQKLLDAVVEVISDDCLRERGTSARRALLSALAAIIVAARVGPHELEPEIRECSDYLTKGLARDTQN